MWRTRTRQRLSIIEVANKRLGNILRDPSVNVSLNDTLPAVIFDFKGRALLLNGKQAEALVEYNRAAEGFESVLAKVSDGAEKEVVKKNLVIELLMIGQLSRGAGDLEKARSNFRRAGEVLDGIDDKASSDYRRMLIDVYREIGIGTSDVNPREALRRATASSCRWPRILNGKKNREATHYRTRLFGPFSNPTARLATPRIGFGMIRRAGWHSKRHS